MRAGRKAFAKKGLGGVSLREDILADSGVSAGSFYHQFEGKEHLLIEILRHDGELLHNAHRELQDNPEFMALDPAERGRKILSAIFDRMETIPEFLQIYTRETHSSSAAVRRVTRELYENSVEYNRKVYADLAEELGVDMNPDTAAKLSTIFSFAVANHYLQAPKSQRAQVRAQLTQGYSDLLTGGITQVK